MGVAQWGTIPDWVAAIGTVLAFFGTVYVISRDGRTRKREQTDAEWDEANKVSITVRQVAGPEGPDGEPTNELGIEITNGGRRSVYKLDVLLIVQQMVRGAHSIEDIPPNRINPIFHLPWMDEAWGRYGFTGNVVITFTDTQGRRWMKDYGGHLTSPITGPSSWWGQWRSQRRLKLARKKAG